MSDPGAFERHGEAAVAVALRGIAPGAAVIEISQIFVDGDLDYTLRVIRDHRLEP